IMLDSIFGPKRYLNEIVWRLTTAHNDPKKYGRITDRILYYAKSSKKTFNREFQEYSDEQVSRFKYQDERGPFKAENLTPLISRPLELLSGAEYILARTVSGGSGSRS
ncbi:MAG: hypothetical protein ACM3S1_07865, partial [Hyphomicrobiales bacterium]